MWQAIKERMLEINPQYRGRFSGSSSVQEPVKLTGHVKQRKQRSQHNKT